MPPVRRVPGYAGMKRAEWHDWRQVAETFVAERPCADPLGTVEVLVLVLGMAGSWAELVGAGAWVQLAPTELYVHYVPGYRAARTYALLDRFTVWLHARGDVTDWQRDVMRSEIDAQRAAHGCAEQGVRRVRELRFGTRAEALTREWVRRMEHPDDRTLAGRAVRVLVSQLHVQLGESREPPLGSLDVDALIREVVRAIDGAPDAAERELFALLSSYYRWLGDEAHLEPRRALWLSRRLAHAALGIAA